MCLARWLVEDSLIDSIRDRIVYELAQNQTIFERINFRIHYDSGLEAVELTSCFVKQLHGIRWDRQPVAYVRISSQDLIHHDQLRHTTTGNFCLLD